MNPISLGAALSALGVTLGAFGTHGLRHKIAEDLLQIYETGTHYLMLHAFALILFGLSRPKRDWPAWCFAVGILIFSGSLYAIVFTEIRKFGMITPIGGILFIMGWIGFVINSMKPRKSVE
jgi:uncharacterized membrane protein YgdD (TMEM256/DUF423 family)